MERTFNRGNKVRTQTGLTLTDWRISIGAVVPSKREASGDRTRPEGGAGMILRAFEEWTSAHYLFLRQET
jgi:hypothetical protein